MKEKLKNCGDCGEEISKSAKRCPHCGAKQKKPFYKKWWFWAILAFVLIGSSGSGEGSAPSASRETAAVQTRQEEAVPETDAVQTAETEAPVPTEYKNALKKAKSYSEFMHMSKAAIYDQLTSEYGEQFPEDAAQYAMEHLDADFYFNALKKAESYSDTMHMSKAGIYDQLTSEYGEQFTPEEAQYAVDNLEADYKANALEKAKSYQELMSMSRSAIYDQLVSEYGEQFTPEEAQYAIDNLE